MAQIKRFSAIALCIVLALTLFPAATEAPFETVIEVKWNYGYVGSMGNALGNENKLGSVGNAGSSYRYTDIVHIEKAGTTVWFTELGTGDSGYCARTGYSISSWKKVGNDYVLDTEWANYPGTDGVTAGIATRSGNTMTYMYTTSRDNEYLRFCFTIGGDTDSKGNVIYPTIYSAYTQNPGTFNDECAADAAAVSFNEDGTVSGFNWFDGYVGSNKNDLYYVKEIRPYYTEYSYTGIITVPRAGTTITFTDSSEPFADSTVYTISSWKPAGQTWVIDESGSNFDGSNISIMKTVSGTRSYSYTTKKDNENLRLCVRTSGVLSSRPTVYWSAPDPDITEPENTGDNTPDAATETLPTPDVTAPQDENPNAESPDGTSEKADISEKVPAYLLSFTGAAYAAGIVLENKLSFKRKKAKKDE